MKKLIILLTLLVGAQPIRAQLTLGVKAGGSYCITNASLGDEPLPVAVEPTAVNGFGYHGGVFAEWELSDKLFLRSELLYSVRNHSFDESFDSTFVFQGFPLTARAEALVKVQRTYVELPLLAGYKLGENFSIVVGPAAMYLLSSNANTNGELTIGSFFQGIELPLSNTNSSTEGLREIGFAAVGGVNYRSKAGFDLGLRYWHGLGTLEENTDLLRTRQGMLQLSAGFAFVR